MEITISSAGSVIDPYAGLTFTTFNFDVDEQGDPITWSTWGVGTPPASISNDDAGVFLPHTQNGGTDPAENGANMDYVIGDDPGAGTYIRCEHTLGRHIDHKVGNQEHWMKDDGTQYAVAYPFQINVVDNNDPNLNGGGNEIADIGPLCHIYQWHDNTDGVPPLTIAIFSGDLVLWDYFRNGEVNPTTPPVIISNMAVDTTYEMVIGYKVEDGGTDVIQIYIDGSLVVNISDAGFFDDALNHYGKQGLYWGGKVSYGNDVAVTNKIRMGGWGMFAGVDAITAALIRVQET